MIETNHYQALVGGYGTAVVAWLVAGRLLPRLWPAKGHPPFTRPWVEIGFLAPALAVIILFGVLYGTGVQLPARGPFGPMLETLNHLIIFSPLLLLLFLRRHALSTAWLPTDRIAARLGLGAAMAILALAAFSLIRAGADPIWQALPRLARYAYLPHFVQVFLEDAAIAMLFVRLGALIRRPWLLAPIVGALFAAAHAPALLAQGLGPREMGYLLADFLLAAGIIFVLQRSRDVLWFFPVHFVMDMSQYSAISGVAAAG
jgi:hypothetical protein